MVSASGSCKYQEENCVTLAASHSEKKCGSVCTEPSDECQNCLMEKLPKNCKYLPSAECFKCSKSTRDSFSICKNESDILTCIKDTSDSECVPCTCNIATLLYHPSCSIHKMCQSEDTNQTWLGDFWIHSQFNSLTTKVNCAPGWVPLNNATVQDLSCFRAFKGRFNFDGSFGECGRKFNRDGRLAIPDTFKKCHAVKESVKRLGNNRQYWIAGKGKPPKKDDWSWIGKDNSVTVENNCWKRGYPKGSPSKINCMLANKQGRWLNNFCNKKRSFVCEAPCQACGLLEGEQAFCCGGVCVNNKKCIFPLEGNI